MKTAQQYEDAKAARPLPYADYDPLDLNGMVGDTRNHAVTIFGPIKKGAVVDWKATALALGQQTVQQRKQIEGLETLVLEEVSRTRQAMRDALAAGRHANELDAILGRVRRHWSSFFWPWPLRPEADRLLSL